MRLRRGPLKGDLAPQVLLKRAEAVLEASQQLELEMDKARAAQGLPVREAEVPFDAVSAWLYSVRHRNRRL